MAGVLPGPDDRLRCAWAVSAPEYLEYHDQEWGSELHGTVALYERLVLEGFQSGLSWITILRKRPAFREAFAGFDPTRVAAFGPDDTARLLADARIVRNPRKIAAAIGNARAVLTMQDAGDDLDRLLWSFAPAPRTTAVQPHQVEATTAESTAMAAELRRRGFAFVGPTTCYALMQATGMVNDHLAGCWRAPASPGLRKKQRKRSTAP
jgi:DNA-3-methyladenine glycosylase I